MLYFKYLVSGFLSLTICLATSLAADAQGECLPAHFLTGGPSDHPYWVSDIVFTGTAEKVIFDQDRKLVRFKIDRLYRGTAGESVEVYSLLSVTEKEQYFVYAKNGSDGRLNILNDGPCGTPPIVLAKAGDELDYAEEVASGKSGTRISGVIYEDHWELGSRRRNVPIPDVEVTVRSKRNKFTTRTDANGKYIFKDIPVGQYHVTAHFPTGLRERSRPVSWKATPYKMSEGVIVIGEYFASDMFAIQPPAKPKRFYRHTASLDLVGTSLSSISGKFIGSDGNTPPQQAVLLIRVGDTGNALSDGEVARVWAGGGSGELHFEDVPEGKYLLVINPNNCHDQRAPQYGRTFYPGVPDEGTATIIAVGKDQRLNIGTFTLLPPLKERWFSGVAMSADGSPIDDATVVLFNKTRSKSPDNCSGMVDEVKTGSDGHFRLKGYESYGYSIRAFGPGEPSTRRYSKIFEISPMGKTENTELTVMVIE